MDALQKLQAAIRNPQEATATLERQSSKLAKIAVNDTPVRAAEIICAGILGWDRYIQLTGREKLRKKQILDFEMYLDITDGGISRDLLANGIREQLETQAYQQELRLINEESDSNVTVLELGANIGYYVLIAHSILNSDCRIYAFEPHPNNVNILNKNILLNGIEDLVEVEQCAVGNLDGEKTLEVSPYSNCHKVSDDPEHGITIETKTVDTILTEKEISPGEVDVVRMDVEGYEWAIFEGMSTLLESDSDLLIFLEFHSSMSIEKKQELVDMFEENNLEMISVFQDRSTPDTDLKFEDLLEEDSGGTLFLKK